MIYYNKVILKLTITFKKQITVKIESIIIFENRVVILVVEVSISHFEFDVASGNNRALKLDKQEISLVNPYRIPNSITLFF